MDFFADASLERFWCGWLHDSTDAPVFGFLLSRLLGDIDKVLPDNRKRLYQQNERHELSKAPCVFIRSQKWLVLFAWYRYLDCTEDQSQACNPDGCRERGKSFENGEVGYPDSDDDTVKKKPAKTLCTALPMRGDVLPGCERE